MPTAHSLVAPTQKLSDDAAYPTSPPQAAQPHGHSIPPQNSQSPYAQQPDARALTTRPAPGAPPAANPYNAGLPPSAGTAQPRSISPVNAPLGSSPPSGRQNSQPPRAHTTPPADTSIPPVQRTSGPQPRRQTPAESVAAAAPAGRRWGLIVVVLLLDLGLAAAGAWMLSQGLASSEAATTTDSRPAATSPASHP